MDPQSLRASRWALLFVILAVGASFAWWFRHRPSYLLYQADKAMASGNQAALVGKYQELLRNKDLPKLEEIRLRKALGNIYLQTFQNRNGISMFFKDPRAVESPYIELGKKEFTRVTTLDPNDAQAHYYIGRILWYRGLESYAMQELELSRKADPTYPEPLWCLARVNLERANPSAARELALQALAIAPRFTDARYVLIDAYAELGEFDKVDQQYALLSAEAKSDPHLMASYAFYLSRQDRWGEALSLADQAVRLSPNNGWVIMYYGQILLHSGREEEASGFFYQAGVVLPDSVWPRIYQTEAYAQRGLCEEAVRASQPLVESFPGWAWSHMMNAWTSLCALQADKALSSLNEALRLAPDLFDATHLKSQILLDELRFDELGTVIRPLLEKKRHQAEAYGLLARSFFLQNNFSMAQEMAESANKLGQRNAQSYVILGTVRAQRKDREGARQAFDTAARIRPFDKTILGASAFALAYYLNDAPSSDELSRLVSNGRLNPELWLMWGDLNRAKPNYAEAIAAYQNAIALKPYLLRAHLGLINAYWESGARDQIETALSVAIQINSKNSEVLSWRQKIQKSR